MDTHQALHQRLIFFKHLIIALGHRTGNNQRCTGIVNEHGIHLVHNSVIVGTLHQLRRILSHIVAQVVEAKLIVGTEGDVALISLATGFGVGLMFVYAVHRQTVEHVNGAHPLGVALGQIIIHCYHMYTIARQCVEEHGQCGRQRLTFTGEHLGDFALMQNRATKKLHIEVHHIPYRFITASHPMIVVHSFVAYDIHEIVRGSQFPVEICSRHLYVFVVSKALRRAFYDSKSLGSGQIQLLLINIQHLFLQLVYFGKNRRTILNLRCGNGGFQTVDFVLLLFGGRAYPLLQRLCPGTQFVIGKCLNAGINVSNQRHQRLVGFQITTFLVTENLN